VSGRLSAGIAEIADALDPPAEAEVMRDAAD
jgi:hypothetical protein